MTNATMTERTLAAIQETLAGRGRGFSALLFVGPAVIASIAYMDPGNFATNIQAGARYGYALLWVVLLANAIAMLFQALSAKLGIVTRRNLAEMCRDRLPQPVVYGLWGVSEFAAMATDLAEFIGGAIGLSLLLHIPMMVGMAIVAILTFAILHVERWGFRPIELVIGAFVATIGLCYLVELVIAPVDWGAAARGSMTPALPDAGSADPRGRDHRRDRDAARDLPALRPASVRGAARNDGERRMLLRFSNLEVIVALTAAGLVNIAMVIMAASAFHAGHSDVAEIGAAYATLTPILGPAAAAVFLTSLLASGISSSAVGTMAGQMVMQGFVGFRIPVLAPTSRHHDPGLRRRRPRGNATDALVYSQVALSLALPVPMIALTVFTGRRDIMGAFVNSRVTQAAAVLGSIVILILNVVLVLQTFGVPIPGLPAGG